MISDKIDLYAYYGIERKEANGGYLHTYIRSESCSVKKRPAMLILPGGCYLFLSDREGEPIALEFLCKGYAAFVLSYSVGIKYPTPLSEAQMAVSYIRDNAEKYSIDGKHICVAGFSAGGHLAGLLATLKPHETILDKTIDNLRPNAAILSYPVISMMEFSHAETRKTITGGDKSLCDKLSIEKRVDTKSAPAFIWHTVCDEAVSVENSMMLASAYRKNNIPFSLHIFEKGPHGLSLANDEVCKFADDEKYLYGVGIWVEMACNWLSAHGFITLTE